jgi:3-hydroxy-9,10-secoandrosta-1,3,5(10)-triene-9,17-dione monooxygenase
MEMGDLVMVVKNVNTMVSSEELVQRAREMVPMLREKAESVEKNRMVSKETIDSFIKAGFLKIMQPNAFGGYEMDLEVFCRVLMEIGRGCPSSAWNLAVLGVHNWELGKLDFKAQEDVWGENTDVLIASSYAPFGKVTKVEGGWILDGQWRTSSGCDHADWAFLGGQEYNEDGSVTDHKSILVPRSEYRIVDDWHVFGLEGTGSKSIVLENVFVPDYRSHSTVEDQWVNGRAPLFQLHQTLVFFSCVSSGVLGFAEGAIDLYIEHMKSRINVKTGARAAQSPYVKDRLGRAVLSVRSARARVLAAVREVTEYVNRGEEVPLSVMVPFVLDMASVGKEGADAVLTLHRAQSARGVLSTNPLQRVLRDALAAANHGTQNSDDTAGTLGGFLLGEGVPPMLFNIKGYPVEKI